MKIMRFFDFTLRTHYFANVTIRANRFTVINNIVTKFFHCFVFYHIYISQSINSQRTFHTICGNNGIREYLLRYLRIVKGIVHRRAEMGQPKLL